ncbi:MAG: cupin domain-containing protein [Saprospiraceae bacterium]|nr:cupin domain-containing protein [Saprospiraceae bacterium]
MAGDLTHLREILHPANDAVNTMFSLAHAFLESGEKSLPHRLVKSTETYFILSGQGEIWVDGQATPLEVGDTFFVAPNALQFVKNMGSERLSFLCIVSPPWSEEDEIVYASEQEFV